MERCVPFSQMECGQRIERGGAEVTGCCYITVGQRPILLTGNKTRLTVEVAVQ